MAEEGRPSLRDRNRMSARENTTLIDHVPDDIHALIQELRAHQLELEVRNQDLQKSQNELRESNARFRFLYDNAPAVNIIVTPEGIIEDVNQNSLDQLGYSREEVIGRSGKEFVGDQDRAKLRGALYAALSGQGTGAIEVTVAAKDGTPHVVLFAAGHPVLREKQQIQGVIFTGMDVTESRLSEQRLRDEQKRALDQLQMLIKVSQDVLKQRTREGLLQTVVDSAREMTGAGMGIVKQGYSDMGFAVEATSVQEEYPSCMKNEGSNVPEEEVFLELTEKGVPLLLHYDELRSHSRWQRLFKGNATPRGLLGVPLSGKAGRPSGFIMVRDKAAGEFSKEDEALLVQLASLGSLALQHLEAQAEVETKAEQLEARVKERTDNLLQANTWLAKEVDARIKTENELKELSMRLLSAQENERKLIAMDLHDSIAAGLAAVKMRLERVMNDEPLNSQSTLLLAGTINLVKDTVGKVRGIMTSLRPSMLDHLGILPTIRTHCKEVEEIYPDITVTFQEYAEEKEIPTPLKIVIFRVVQEALNNIGRHSRADQAWVSLTSRNHELELVVSDNGKGFDIGIAENSPGFGISSMRERTRLSGGSLNINHAKSGGIEIRATWPLSD